MERDLCSSNINSCILLTVTVLVSWSNLNKVNLATSNCSRCVWQYCYISLQKGLIQPYFIIYSRFVSYRRKPRKTYLCWIGEYRVVQKVKRCTRKFWIATCIEDYKANLLYQTRLVRIKSHKSAKTSKILFSVEISRTSSSNN